MQEKIEDVPMFDPFDYFTMLRGHAASSEIERHKVKSGESVKVALLVKNPEPSLAIQQLPKVLETLEEVKKLEQFKLLLSYKKQENEEFAKYLERELPNLSNEMLVLTIDYTNSEVEKLWHLRALCVAEAYSRCPKMVGGRHKVGTGGRGELVECLANRFKTSVTNIRLDGRIMSTFGVYKEDRKTTTEPVVVSNEPKKEYLTIKQGENNEYLTVLIHETSKFVAVSTFQPNPRLTREHYVVASRLPAPFAVKAIAEVLTEIEAGEICTAADLERRLFPRKENRPGHFKFERAEYPSKIVKMQLAFDEHDAEVLYEIFAAMSGLKPNAIRKSNEGNRFLEKHGFDCLMKIFREHLKKIKEGNN
jgi:hypothetical protein